MAWTALAYFRDRVSADAAYEDLLRQGYRAHDISVVGRGREGHAGLHDADHVSAGEGAAVGGLAGVLLGVAAMLIPGLGPIVAGGPLAAALAGAVTGGLTGTAVGGVTAALVDAGVDEDEARYYEQRFKEGGLLLAVHVDEARFDEARAILQRHGGQIRGAGEFVVPPSETAARVDQPSIGPDPTPTGRPDLTVGGPNDPLDLPR
jgi:hypothetical protein